MSLVRITSAVCALSLATGGAARAQDEPQPGKIEAAATFLGGAAVAFAAHETGHLVLDAAFGADPYVKKVDFGGIPFFAIAHEPVSPRREFAIASAGFWVQHATDEWLLSANGPIGRAHRAGCRGADAGRGAGLQDRESCRPGAFVKGMFAFNVLTSVGYSMAAFARAGPYERDTRAMASSSRVSEPFIGATLLAPALLDWYRYYHPESAVAKWLSRGVKIGGALLIVR